MLLQYIKHNGSEFDVVIMPIAQAAPMLLTRNLLYTALTRAKQKVILVGDKDALAYAIRNIQGIKRNSALKERLIQSMEKAA